MSGGAGRGVAGGEGGAYAAAGVDIKRGERAVELMKESVGRASRPEVLGGLGGFAGLMRLDVSRWTQPVLAASTDGAGTKTAIARALGRHDTIGQDLVAMVVDDLVVCGAEPLLVQDYIAVGHLEPETVAALVAGIAAGCRLAGAALLGGETAEHPGLMPPGDYDLAATAVGVVEADAVLGPDRVRPGDAVVALASSGVHCNGFALIRQVLAASRTPLREPFGTGTLGEELLTPSRIYALDCLAAAAALPVRTFAHITGGGLAGNLGRVIPEGMVAVVERPTWRPPPVFDWIQATGTISATDMERTFNMGVGMVAVVDPAAAGDLLGLLAERGVPAWTAGTISKEGGTVRARLRGEHPGAGPMEQSIRGSNAQEAAEPAPSSSSST